MDDDIFARQGATIARRIREELAHRRMSRQTLADRARISMSTLEKSLAGHRPFTLATVVRIEDVLGISLHDQAAGNHDAASAPAGLGALAAPSLGAYSRAAVSWLEGAYHTIRPAFGRTPGIASYLTTVTWDDDAGHLRFAESQRADGNFSQTGDVALPHLSGHIYFVTNAQGQYRLAILGRPDIRGALTGLLATLQLGQGTQLVPTACPIIYQRMDAQQSPNFGALTPDDAGYAPYRAMLDRVTSDDFARFPQ